MPLLNSAVEMQSEIVGWRHHIHENPEILFDCVKTSAFVAEKLRAFGCDEVATGIGRTGVVGRGLVLAHADAFDRAVAHHEDAVASVACQPRQKVPGALTPE